MTIPMRTYLLPHLSRPPLSNKGVDGAAALQRSVRHGWRFERGENRAAGNTISPEAVALQGPCGELVVCKYNNHNSISERSDSRMFMGPVALCDSCRNNYAVACRLWLTGGNFSYLFADVLCFSLCFVLPKASLPVLLRFFFSLFQQE